MDPNTQSSTSPINPDQGGSKNTLLTLASLLVLFGIVGITLFLYLKNNKSNQNPSYGLNNEAKNSTPTNIQKKSPSTIAIRKPDLIKVNSTVVCAKFDTLEDALFNSDKACVLDLSGQNLTTVPKDVYKLSKLTEIDLSNNNLTEFPYDLLSVKNIMSINLANNKISTIKAGTIIPGTIQILKLEGNNLDEKTVKQYSRMPK